MENATEPYEQGPIRPPSEADSLLLRLTRNCPWNRCAFCSSYKNERFSLRSLSEIIGDIDAMRRIADKLVALSLREGQQGVISEGLLRLVWSRDSHFDAYDRSMALWLFRGGKSVFLQDADSLVMKTDAVVAVLRHLYTSFPSIERVTTYCRSHTAARKPVAALQAMREAGLTRIHIGLESGSDHVLAMISKGATAEMHVEAGLRVKQAGMELSEYVIPGLGGEDYSTEHARETAQVLNVIDPDFIRLRTLHVVQGTPLAEMARRGEFTPPDDDRIVCEIREWMDALSDIHSSVASDHILNLLEEVQGRLPQDKPRMLSVIDRYLALSPEERLVFRLGRRQGIYRRLDELSDTGRYQELKAKLNVYKHVVDCSEEQKKGLADKMISRLLNGYV